MYELTESFNKKIDTNLSVCQDQFEKIRAVQVDDRSAWRRSLLEKANELVDQITSESENVKTFVTTTT